MRQILYNRGYATEAEARAFLNAETTFDTSPMLMKDMEMAVKRIREAVANGEKMAVYGDYDVDGVTATALLTEVLEALGNEACPYIPNRFDEGYGLNKDALRKLKDDGASLVITVDCGIRSPDEAREARRLGLDLIISDHHEPAGELPDALALLNPKVEGDNYPEKYLAGVGIAYKMAQALLDSEEGRESGLQAQDLLDLVALGTVADLAPLTGENRVLVRAGLLQMRQTKRQGLFSLANVAGVPLQAVNATHIGFMLGPRLNAAGRLESAQAALDLLMAKDILQAGQLAQVLDSQNRDRQALTRDIQEEADALARRDDPEAMLLFAVDGGFNPGVVGLAAARLVETYYRPAVVGEMGEKTTRCSCRSIPEFHITEALDQCAELLVRHGGHAAAAGFTVGNENLTELKRRLNGIAQQELAGKDLRKSLTADMELPLSDLRPNLLEELDALQPTGYGNREAVFVSRDLRLTSKRAVGADSRHLKLTVTDGRLTFDAIGFRLGELADSLPERVDVLYTFEMNEYRGHKSLQLNLKDIKPAGIPDQ